MSKVENVEIIVIPKALSPSKPIERSSRSTNDVTEFNKQPKKKIDTQEPLFLQTSSLSTRYECYYKDVQEAFRKKSTELRWCLDNHSFQKTHQLVCAAQEQAEQQPSRREQRRQSQHLEQPLPPPPSRRSSRRSNVPAGTHSTRPSSSSSVNRTAANRTAAMLAEPPSGTETRVAREKRKREDVARWEVGRERYYYSKVEDVHVISRQQGANNDSDSMFEAGSRVDNDDDGSGIDSGYSTTSNCENTGRTTTNNLTMATTTPVARIVHQGHKKKKQKKNCRARASGDDCSLGFRTKKGPDDGIEFREVQRIHVHDPNAGEKVTDARRSGTPVVLVGQKGWPQFASRWKKKEEATSSKNELSLLDLTQPYELDIERMIQDIGNESVPILEKNYDERKPIRRNARAASFLRQCWPQNGGSSTSRPTSTTTKEEGLLYLHQWQFPNSKTAVKKLCGKGSCATLPNGIFQEDLLRYWLDEQHNPLQYIFMGDSGTFSKLHKDNGGLEITIAPIVGKKECILVHRADGADCLYHLKSNLEEIDLDKFPMTAFARIWKTIVQPGEILLMPSDTYHKCRNVTPCLSYHRFHLDAINLQPFLLSMLEGDAPEIDHDVAIWNITSELMGRVDRYVLGCRRRRSTLRPKPVSCSTIINNTVRTLKTLRPICREIANSFDLYQRQTSIRPKNPLFVRKSQRSALDYWNKIVKDIDKTLHDFNHRDEFDHRYPANETP
eukprot:scaffold3791_cov137-Cylindrotheca_fusiformis.AAC.18